MYPFNKLLFFVSIFFSFNNSNSKIELEKIKSPLLNSGSFTNKNKSNSTFHKAINKKSRSKDFKKRLILEKYNQQLNRHLKTLNYMSGLEINSKFSRSKSQLSDFLNLKTQVQKDIIEITFKIKQYKLVHKIADCI